MSGPCPEHCGFRRLLAERGPPAAAGEVCPGPGLESLRGGLCTDALAGGELVLLRSTEEGMEEEESFEIFTFKSRDIKNRQLTRN